MKDLTILITGEAGFGVESLCKTLSIFFNREGFYVFTSSEYQNKIRGGHIYTFIRISDKKLDSHKSENVDILLSMDKFGIENHQNKMKKDGIVIFDDKKIKKTEDYRQDLKYIGIGFQKIAQTEIGMPLARNVVCAGSLLGVLDYDFTNFKKALSEIFKKKGEEIINKNHKALEAGFNEIKKHNFSFNFEIKPNKKTRYLFHGNEAIVLGAIKAGCKYLSAYPMTPGSTVLTSMATYAKDYDIVVSHVEDEIAAVCNVIGASYAGIRAMTSTSGGGFALKGEAIGLAGMIEAPCLIINAQRPGPSTGMPTHTGQGDLRMAMHCGQGEIPRVVSAPGSHEECFKMTFDMFNIIEKYQIPGILLTEKYLADTYKSIDDLDLENEEKWKIKRGEIVKNIGDEEDFKRYKFTESGISPRSIPGIKNGIYTASSYEHNEFGKNEEGEEGVVKMKEKRARKIELLKKDLPMPILHGKKDSQFTIIGWGATKGPILEALEILEKKGISINFVQFQYILPFKDEIEEMLKGQKLISIETSGYSQMAGIITENTALKFHKKITDISGRQIDAEFVVKKILETV